jgi:alcohol dehydrogenase (NADP+)
VRRARLGPFPLIEVIPIQKINEAYERMLKGDVRYRFVIDTASLWQA